MADRFFALKEETPKTIAGLLRWADANGFSTSVTMLDVVKSVGRIKSDKSFEEVLALVVKEKEPFIRVILRKDWNLYGILTKDTEYGDFIEIGACTSRLKRNYYISIFIRAKRLEEIRQRYQLIELGA